MKSRRHLDATDRLAVFLPLPFARSADLEKSNSVVDQFRSCFGRGCIGSEREGGLM